MKTYECVCGKVFDNPQKFNGHKSNCIIHKKAKGTYEARITQKKQQGLQYSENAKIKREAKERANLIKWISEQHTCEKCGIIMTEKFGPGRFCSRKCSNSRKFSSETNEKKRLANKGKVAYSNQDQVIFIKPDEMPPENFHRGNFIISKNYKSFEDFVLGNKIKLEKIVYQRSRNTKPRQQTSKKYYLDICKELIRAHNESILIDYEQLLANKAKGKTFHVENTFLYANYLSVTNSEHPRQNQGHVFVHVLLAECLLDRSLNSSEIVHHKDSNKLHNTFDNIYIFNDKASHGRFHHSKNYWLTIDNDVLICTALSKEDLIDLSNTLKE